MTTEGTRIGLLAGTVVLAVLLAPGRVRAQGAAANHTDATPVPVATSPIRTDGRLDDGAWQSAVDLGPLTQREPFEGTTPSERTVVLLTFDADTLYIGVRCDDGEPAKIVRTQMARDADLQNDDNIEIVLDTFLDHRNGYYFQVNALGAIGDGVISNNAEPKKEWDGTSRRA